MHATGHGGKEIADGLTYEFPRSVFDAFVELVPLLLVTPAGGVGFDAAIGVRVYS